MKRGLTQIDSDRSNLHGVILRLAVANLSDYSAWPCRRRHYLWSRTPRRIVSPSTTSDLGIVPVNEYKLGLDVFTGVGR